MIDELKEEGNADQQIYRTANSICIKASGNRNIGKRNNQENWDIRADIL
jgi:hypothetical protein